MREVRGWEGARFIGEAPMPRGGLCPKWVVLGRLWHRALPDGRGTGGCRGVRVGEGEVRLRERGLVRE